MKATEFLTETAAFEKGPYSVMWHEAENYYTVLKNGEEVGRYPYKSRWEGLAAAYDAAKKEALRLYFADTKAEKDKFDHSYQIDRPLTNLEQEWILLRKKLIKAARKEGPLLTDKELNRFSSLANSVVRKSILDGTHPIMKDEK